MAFNIAIFIKFVCFPKTSRSGIDSWEAILTKNINERIYFVNLSLAEVGVKIFIGKSWKS
jgi:hypothetical protein